MQRQYRAIKRELPPGAILMFRLGDFYEMFGEDAVIASPILGATLTQRAGAPLCGIPYHALDAYLAKLIRAGKTAAICDQMEDPRLVKKGQVVRREVTRIVTPGTVTEDGLLDAGTNTYIAAVSGLGLALLDLSTGEFAVEPFETRDRLDDALARLRPAEIVLPRPEDDAPPPAGVSYTDAWTFSFDAAQEELLRHFNVTALDGFGLEGKKDLVCAAGALLYYVHTTLRHAVGHVRSVRLRESADFLALDAGTIRHLALLPGDGVSREASLLGVLNATRTPMGARRLAAWIRQPLRRVVDINARLDCVEAFVKDRIRLSSLQARLGDVRDLERLIAKVDSGRANARDLKALAASLRPMPEIIADLAEVPAVGGIAARMSSENAVVDLVDRAIAESPNVLLTEGNLIAPGYNADLDELRALAAEGNRWIAEYQAKEVERTGIKTLRVRRNSVFGFYIEISKAAAAGAPPEYERRQTLTNAERFTTPELKEYERKVLGRRPLPWASSMRSSPSPIVRSRRDTCGRPSTSPTRLRSPTDAIRSSNSCRTPSRSCRTRRASTARPTRSCSSPGPTWPASPPTSARSRRSPSWRRRAASCRPPRCASARSTACSRASARATTSRADAPRSSWRCRRRRTSSTTRRRARSSCSTRSAAAPPRSTASRSRGAWPSTCTRTRR